MNKFEYMPVVFELAGPGFSTADEETLRGYGEDGWESDQMCPAGDQKVLILFRRPLVSQAKVW